MVRERSPSRSSSAQHASPHKTDRQPLANISAKMQSPSSNPPTARDQVGDVEFGKASPLRNPLKKPTSTGVFIPKRPVPKAIAPQSRPQTTLAPRTEVTPERRAFYLPGQRSTSNGSDVAAAMAASMRPPSQIYMPNPVGLPRPMNPAPYTSLPASRPTFSSIKHATYNPQQYVDLTRASNDDDEDRFDPDAAIRAEGTKFGAPDPYMYVDSSQANENMKNLLEGAFDDEDGKSKTRLRSRAKKAAQAEKESKSLADKLAALDVKQKEEEADEDDEEEEEDGTVDGLTVKLLPHQVEGVAWMIEKEIGVNKRNGVVPYGGILADDMGLGKTVQSVALLLTNPRPAPNAKPEFPKQKLPGKNVSKCTLVVAPLALIKQWETEIKTKVARSHALKVLVHHGASRTKSSLELKKYDVVITTYQTLTSEHAGSSMNVDGGSRIGCFGVHWYRILLDEAHSIKNRNAKSTQACYALNSYYRWCLTGTPLQNNLDELQSLIKFLKIKPYCELTSWKDDIIKPMKNGRGGLAMRRLKAFLQACMKRRTKDILKKDGALNFGGKASKEGEEKSGGMQIVAREVLTVECEFDKSEQRFYDRLSERADSRLADMMAPGRKADYIGALVLLLRLRQACNHPQLIESAMNKDKDAMTTGASSQASRGQSQGGDNEMDALTAMMGGVTVGSKACDVCQAKLSSQETRDGAARCFDCEADLADVKKSKIKEEKIKTKQAPPKENQRRARNRRIIHDSDDEDEAEGEWIAGGPEREVKLGRAGGSDDEDAEGGGESLDSIDSTRSDERDSQVKDTPPRAHHRKNAHDSDASNTEDSTEEEDEDEEESDADSDILDGMEYSGKAKHAPSTKIRQLLRILHKETSEHKTIVFSQFTTMLDLIEPHLNASKMRFVRYDGSMKPDARESSLNSLRTDPKTRILLCSLKCGSLGLNLTAASRVVIVEPFWNPFVEEQAIDRVHRLNQTVDVKVFRLTVRNTVEARIIELQERKRELAKAAIEGGTGAGKLSMQDILGLFRHDAVHSTDAEDREFEEKFGGDTRLLEAGSSADAHDRAKDIERMERPAERVSKAGKERVSREHEVYGRRW